MIKGFKAFEQGIPAQVIRTQRELAQQLERSEIVLARFRESERILDVLRSVPAIPRTLDQPTIQKFMTITADVRRVDLRNEIASTLAVDPREYFAQRFPEQTKKFGPTFFGTIAMLYGCHRFIPEAINDLAFAAILGGDQQLCHDVVWCLHEETFYFNDFRVGAYCPTTEAKMSLLASNWLIRCSEACHPISGKAVIALRAPQTLKNVISTAKTMLEADAQFFSGKAGHRRYVDGRFIEANQEPSYQVFVKKAIVRQPEAKLTVGDAFHRYYQFCRDNAMTPLTRSVFKDLVAEVIREQYGLGIRHDVEDERGKQSHGWLGLRVDAAGGFGEN